MNTKNLVFVTYDGILNPVFSGQVIQPILSIIKENPDIHIYLICFEKDFLSTKIIDHFIPKHPNLSFIKLKRYAVLHKVTLLHSVYLLKKILRNLALYSIKARGPFAGWVCMHAIENQKCKNFTVQARSLAAVEYEMLITQENKLDVSFHNYRKKLFEKIEKEIYAPKKFINNFVIESITPALSEYLTKNYFSQQEHINIAYQDFPTQVTTEQKIKWRTEIRSFLKLANTTHIYCYNGSVKPWQSIDMTINFFKDKLKENKDIFLLVLTQDTDIFEYLLSSEKIESIYYKILKIKHEEIYKYLSACDTGLLFRKPHLANWISRPVKAMEYNAAGLNIIHNNTVKWLIDQNINKEIKNEIS